MLGFETVGNATVIVHDGTPVLATDPWLTGHAYFGSWGLTHEIPKEQLEHIRACPSLFISHGHPDHLSMESLDGLAGKKILLAPHAGARIARDLGGLGYDVQVLPAKEWVQLSPRVKIQTVPDWNQDSILLIDVGGVLLLNLNDASDRGWGDHVLRVAREYKRVWLLSIGGYGDATMINYWSEDGRRIVPKTLQRNIARGTGFRQQEKAQKYGANFVVPFSSLHRYQRDDSIWANEYVCPLSEYRRGFGGAGVEMTDAFVIYDVEKDELRHTAPREYDAVVYPSTQFGDDWSESLSAEDKARIAAYFAKRETLRDAFRYLNLRVGGQDFVVDIDKQGSCALTFEVPRGSLMQAIEWEVFDDLLIGNFMKTTLHGDFHFREIKAPLLFGDNGQAFTHAEVEEYLAHYRKMFAFDWFRRGVRARKRSYVKQAVEVAKRYVRPESPAYQLGRRIHQFLR